LANQGATFQVKMKNQTDQNCFKYACLNYRMIAIIHSENRKIAA